MQDGTPCHSVRTTTASLSRHKIRLLPWPFYSLGLNPIEHKLRCDRQGSQGTELPQFHATGTVCC